MALCFHRNKQLGKPWVRLLISEYKGKQFKNGYTALYLLLMLDQATDADFSCDNFWQLWGFEKNICAKDE